REIHGLAAPAVVHLVGMHAVEPGAVRVAAVRVLIGQWRRIAAGVPLLAARDAGMTADAGVEIDHQAELLFGGRRQFGHDIAPDLARARGSACIGSNCGALSPASFGAAFSMLT